MAFRHVNERKQLFSRRLKRSWAIQRNLLFLQVSLEPPGLARKRTWNRKYPICITLAEGEIGEETFDEGQEEEEKAEKHTIPSQSSPVTLYLFGRTGREKEEWFQHLLLASKAGAVSSNEDNTGKVLNEKLTSVTAVTLL